jgi:phasin family protein
MAKANGTQQQARQQAEFAGAKEFSDLYAGYSRLFGDVARLFVNGRAPAFDVAALVDAQKKNLEAWTTANKVAFEGAQVLAQRQAEMVRQAFQDFSGVTGAFVGEGTAEEKLIRQADFAKGSYEQALANFGELSELAQKSGAQAMAVINKRIVENFDEVKSALAKTAGR